MLKKVGIVLIFLLIVFLGVYIYLKNNRDILPEVFENMPKATATESLQIAYLKNRSYLGSSPKIEQTLTSGTNYKKYIVSYISDDLRIYGLLTIPNGNVPDGGFPAIIFNHGYITPQKYTSDGNYIAYVDAFAKEGYVVFKPDYRGNGKSQGVAGSAYFSSNYVVDDLNAIASIKKMNEINPNKIGVWGHSMGGHITLTDLVVSKDIRAAVIWGGVVGSYNDILYNWQNRVSYKPDEEDLELRNLNSQSLIDKYGSPNSNPDFWNSVDPLSNLNLITAPLQLHVGLSDNQVPPDFSQKLYDKMQDLGKTVEFYSYKGADHNISQSFSKAMSTTLDFFNKYLKQ